MLKRVALARAIIRKPVILLCDEPFSGLDPVSVKMVAALLVRLNRRLGITMLVVSHHIVSTMRMADRVVLLLPDRKVEGTPAELERSTDPRVVEFLQEDPGAGLAAGAG
jgi:phospholipid/cholesterol/gamma-HCH transport system ATP-binding protein